MLEHANIKQVSINDYLNKKYNKAIFSNISPSGHVERKNGKASSYENFILEPHEYNYKSKKLSI